ncbi:MAG TPA: hypothetical protein VG248_00900 [Caulobacteraceae bacterium]|nr:hypothetical protein [Caulobacteraceae bacterium]
MSTRYRAAGLALASVAALSLATLGLCAGPAAAKRFRNLDEAGRTIDGGRAVEVIVAQGEIKSNIIVSQTPGQGLVGALIAAAIDAKINSDRAHKAESAIQPLRAALNGYDVDAAAMSATQAGVDKTSWFKSQAMSVSRDESVPGRTVFLDASGKTQVAFFSYGYEMTPDFSAVRVTLEVEIVDRAAGQAAGSDHRFSHDSLPMFQHLVCVEVLPGATTLADDNVNRWAADNGKLARLALNAAFGDMKELIPRALELTDPEVKLMRGKDKKRETLGDYTGRIQDEGPTGQLMYSDLDGLVSVRPLVGAGL